MVVLWPHMSGKLLPYMELATLFLQGYIDGKTKTIHFCVKNSGDSS